MEVKWMRSWDMGTGEPWEWRGRGIAQVERRKWDWGQREGWWSKNCEGRCGTRGVGHVMCNGGLTRSQQNYNRILEETWLPSACIHFNHGNDRKSEGEPSLLTNDLLSYTMHFLWSSVLIISSPGWSLSPGVFAVVWWKLQLMYWETRREYWKLFFFTVKSFLEWASWWSQLPLGPNWHLQLLQLTTFGGTRLWAPGSAGVHPGERWTWLFLAWGFFVSLPHFNASSSPISFHSKVLTNEGHQTAAGTLGKDLVNRWSCSYTCPLGYSST